LALLPGLSLVLAESARLAEVPKVKLEGSHPA
jgi:hypothetical protein